MVIYGGTVPLNVSKLLVRVLTDDVTLFLMWVCKIKDLYLHLHESQNVKKWKIYFDNWHDMEMLQYRETKRSMWKSKCCTFNLFSLNIRYTWRLYLPFHPRPAWPGHNAVSWLKPLKHCNLKVSTYVDCTIRNGTLLWWSNVLKRLYFRMFLVFFL